jgi:hypothetical protein
MKLAAGQDLEAGVLEQDLRPVLHETPLGMGAELAHPGRGGKGHLAYDKGYVSNSFPWPESLSVRHSR